MPARTGTAHVVTTRRKYKDQVYCTHLLRRSYREGGTVKNETLGNLSHLPDELIEIIRRSLQGETFVPLAQAFEISRSRPHGHVKAVSLAMQRLDMASLIASKACGERDLVLAMLASRIIDPATKLATTRLWHTTTLAEEFGVTEATEDDLYAAMDWLLARQDTIQKKLAARHLREGALGLYDLSSSYFEGTTCPLAKRGYSRDGRAGTLQVNYGLLTDARGCPVAVSVHEGNTADSRTFMPAVHKLREDFGIERMVMVGDRGMVSQKAIDEMRERDGIGWITALKSVSIRALVEQGHLQMDLFDERNLLEISSPEYPGSIKTIDLKVRPIHHRLADRVRAHIFLCTLAYYVEWHLREAWRELMFADTEQQAKATRDPVAPAARSASAQAKAASRALTDGTPAHSFSTLMAELATLARNTCRAPNAAPDAPTFAVITTAQPTHQRAFELVRAIIL